MKRFLGVLAALAGLQALLVGAYWAVERSKHIEVRPQEFPAADLVYKKRDGREHRLSEHRGQPLLLHFWASWCPPCIDELPQVLALGRDSPVAILALSFDEDWESVRRFVGAEPPAFVGLADGEQAGAGFQFKTLPQSFLIDAAGTVRLRFDGPRDWTSGAMRRLLEEAAGEPIRR